MVIRLFGISPLPLAEVTMRPGRDLVTLRSVGATVSGQVCGGLLKPEERQKDCHKSVLLAECVGPRRA